MVVHYLAGYLNLVTGILDEGNSEAAVVGPCEHTISFELLVALSDSSLGLNLGVQL
jgi:hypothetical protein